MKHIVEDYDTGDGVIRGIQFTTYDCSLTGKIRIILNQEGANTFIGSLYLAALRAAEEMGTADTSFLTLKQSYKTIRSPLFTDPVLNWVRQTMTLCVGVANTTSTQANRRSSIYTGRL